MGAPSINILFSQKGTTAIKRGQRGIVAVLLLDTVPTTNPIVMSTVADIPTTLTADNIKQLNLAFMGYVNPPIKVIAYVMSADTTDFSVAQHYLETIKWDYLAFPSIPDASVTTFATWIKGLRDTVDKKVKMVLPLSVSDHEGIYNYANVANVQSTKTFTAKEYCSRMAGFIAGTPLTISATYGVLPELIDCDHLNKAEMDVAVDDGKLILMNDGKKVKVVRAVNSLTTTTTDKGNKFKKIKIVDITDLIHDDIKETTSDSYVGKVPNDYDHKVLLMSAISGYFDQLELGGLLQKGSSSVFIDLVAQTAYLKTIGVDTSVLSEQEIKEYNTDEKVFIGAKATILDSMEDININVGI